MEPIPEFSEVLAAAQAGDERAADVLFMAHQPFLLRYLRSQERRTAEDLAGEVWLAAAQGLADFRGDGTDFRAWLFSIARRRVADHRRRGIRRRTDSVDPETFAEMEAVGDTEETAVDRVSAQEAVDLMVRHLSRDQAEVLIFRVVADLDAARTAVLMGRSESWVRTTQQRALQRLARRLGRESGVTI